MDNFARAMVPLFVAVDPFGLLPIYVGLTEGTAAPDRRRILSQALATALAISLAFVLFGGPVLRFMHITPDDFKIAGGLLLLCTATIDLVGGLRPNRRVRENVGPVPLGTPLIAGPAVLTTSLILVGEFGLAATLLSVIVNILLAGVVLSSADLLTRLLRPDGMRAVSKVAALVLAAFAVMMVRMGVLGIVQAAR